MRTRTAPRTLAALSFLLLTAGLPASAASGGPVHLQVTKPLTRVTDVLASLSQQTGTPILADDTVVDTLGVTNVDKPSLEAALDFLKTQTPSLSWQRVSLPQDAPLPAAGTLAAQVRALRAIAATGLVVTDPGAHSTVSFQTSAEAPPAPPAGMRVVYLVTNEAVRAQREANKKAAEQKPTGPVNTALNSVNTAADAFAGMSADQQRQAIPQLIVQFGRMIQSLDPTVRQEMGQQWQQMREQRQQGNGGQ